MTLAHVVSITNDLPMTGQGASLGSQLLGQYDLADQLRFDLERLRNVPFNKDYSDYAEGIWASLALFNRDGDASSSLSYEYDGRGQWTDNADLLPEIKRVANDLFDMGVARSARIFVAEGGGLIREHRDYLEFKKGFSRLHLVLQTNSGSMNGENNIAFHMAPGQVWYIDGTKPHWAVNFEETPRYHLAVDFPAGTPFQQCVRVDKLGSSSIVWRQRPSLPDELSELVSFAASKAVPEELDKIMGPLDRLYVRSDFHGLRSFDLAMMGCAHNLAFAHEIARRRRQFLGI